MSSPGLLRPLRRLFALPNDDPRKTLAVAVVLCLACSVVVSATAVTLRPLQARNAALELQKEVVKVAGLGDSDLDLAEAFERIDMRLVDLDTGELVDGADAAAYSYRDAALDAARSEALADDPAGIRRRPDLMPVYLVRDNGALETIVLPVYGQGLWSTMHGLLALAPDGRVVRALSFYEQRETAGLGSEVASPKWLGQWPGKTVIGPDGEPVIEVLKGRVDPNAPHARNQIDGLSGATLTAKGVHNLMRFWLGEQGYGPFLARLRSGEG
jgi:Na+-transporting NADH:ubiquinone oxidoreductase subunit C